jgi:NOL1/NOP2/fmu family ribosome biogenesis protein
MNIELVEKKQRKEIKENLKENYGIELDFPFHLIRSGKEKLRIFTGDINETELSVLNALVRIDCLGMYFAFVKDELRLSFDSTISFRKKVKKNILELNKEQALQWMSGKNLDVLEFKNLPEFKDVLVKYKDDILGQAKINNSLWNFVPKERRTRIID